MKVVVVVVGSRRDPAIPATDVDSRDVGPKPLRGPLSHHAAEPIVDRWPDDRGHSIAASLSSTTIR